MSPAPDFEEIIDGSYFADRDAREARHNDPQPAPAVSPQETTARPLTRETLKLLERDKPARGSVVTVTTDLYCDLLATARQGLADSARLDWLERTHSDVTFAWTDADTVVAGVHPGPEYADTIEGATAREAIDKAVATRSGLRSKDGGENA